MAIDSKVLAQIHYFVGLSPDELESVKQYIDHEKKVEKGEIFLIEEEQSDYLPVDILPGTMHLGSLESSTGEYLDLKSQRALFAFAHLFVVLFIVEHVEEAFAVF